MLNWDIALMRLPPDYAEFLKAEILAVRPGASVYLFGSRVDDSRRGGDVDILVLADPKLIWEETSGVRRRFWERFGFQKLDLICFHPGESSAFKELALLDAVRL